MPDFGRLRPSSSAELSVGIGAGGPEPWELLNTALARFDPETVTPFRQCCDAWISAPPCKLAARTVIGLTATRKVGTAGTAKNT